ncbi:MAG: DUF411 domain-containing protein [Gammaproteobacteria bacterium]|nr:DUF411 domain-containing protein [Gammaproteobacteria bacterium]
MQFKHFQFPANNLYRLRGLFPLVLALALTSCQQENINAASQASLPEEVAKEVVAKEEVAKTILQVFKDPTCGCCELWIDHVNDHGFVAQINHPENLALEKLNRGVPPIYQSCHTAVSEQGYFFEGHVPAKIIQRFLDEQPDYAVGLAVPGMPMGSPGMEIGDQFQPYEVLLIKADGTAEVYASIKTKEEQY